MVHECLGATEIEVFVAGLPAASLAAKVEAHIDRCSACRRLVAEKARAPSARTPRKISGSSVGRYELREELGTGGMGVVYTAFDSVLKRDVAVKLARTLGREDTTARLLREAQAAGRINHPNVVEVFDVGVLGQEVYIVMELIPGRTLAHWLKSSRSQRDVLRVFVAAGQGLAAAHAQGVVHRDFKPANVMLSFEERVYVLDFGLAVLGEADVAGTLSSANSHSAHAHATATGARLGTPAYMAPEQHQGGFADERSDQFSYCVALFEALCGQPPFGPHTGEPSSFRRAVLGGKVTTTLPPGIVPAHVESAILRGLALNPADRWPSMAALLTQLRVPRRRPHAKWFALLASVALIVASGVVANSRAEQSPTTCVGGNVMDETWSPVARTTTVDTTLDHISSQLDQYAEQWNSEYRATCGSSGSLPYIETDRTFSCLRNNHATVATVVDALENGRLSTGEDAVGALELLAKLRSCLRVSGDVLPLPEDSDDAALVQKHRLRLASIDVEIKLGQGSARQSEVVDMVRDARALRFAPLVAETLLRLGGIQAGRGVAVQASETLREAYFVAQAASYAEVAVSAASALTAVVGRGLSRPEEGLQWAKHASAILEHTSNLESPQILLLNRGLLRLDVGELQGARQDFELARAHILRTTEPTGPSRILGNVEGSLAALHFKTGNLTGALAADERAIEAFSRAFGSMHSLVAGAYVDRGHSQLSLGQLEDGVASYERALEIGRGRPGFDGVRVRAQVGLAAVYQLDDRLELAVEFYRNALAELESTRGVGHPVTANVLHNLALSLDKLGRYDLALARSRQAVGVLEQHFGPESPSLVVILSGLGRCSLHAGTLDEAARAFRRSLDLFVATFGATHVRASSAHNGLGYVALERREYEAALKHFERTRRLLAPRPDLGASVEGIESRVGRALAEMALGAVVSARHSAEQAFEMCDQEPVVCAWEPLLPATVAWALEKAAMANPRSRAEPRARARELFAEE